MKTAKGGKLEFIGRIKSDGTGIIRFDKEQYNDKGFMETDFDLYRLSITSDTYIATDLFFYYTCKLKPSI